MGLFNRYRITNDLNNSFWEKYAYYCNPKDYSVSEEDCRRYLDDLENGDKLNTEWNRKRRSRWTSITIVVLLAILIPTLYFIVYYFNDSIWDRLLSYILVCSILGASFWVFNTVDMYIQLNKIYLGQFYPEVNENIERLFDDYLWKCKLVNEAKLKSKEEWQKTHDKIAKMSHPGIDQFIEALEEELKNPTEENLLGDVKFNMTQEEIYKTKVFTGLSIEQYGFIHLGYRSSYIEPYYSIRDPVISFEMVNCHLEKIIIRNHYLHYDKKGVIEPFISCCEKLNLYYGNPTNLKKNIFSKEYELDPYDKAVFQFGKKSIILNIVKSGYMNDERRLELVFSISSSDAKIDAAQQPFDRSWFNILCSRSVRHSVSMSL